MCLYYLFRNELALYDKIHVKNRDTCYLFKKRYIFILFFNGSPTLMACCMQGIFVLVLQWNGDVYFCPLPSPHPPPLVGYWVCSDLCMITSIYQVVNGFFLAFKGQS